MIALIYLVSYIVALGTIVGPLFVFVVWGNDAFEPIMWILTGIMAVLGIWFGVASWEYDVPPRWFWSKSKLELFENRVGYVIGN